MSAVTNSVDTIALMLARSFTTWILTPFFALQIKFWPPLERVLLEKLSRLRICKCKFTIVRVNYYVTRFGVLYYYSNVRARPHTHARDYEGDDEAWRDMFNALDASFVESLASLLAPRLDSLRRFPLSVVALQRGRPCTSARPCPRNPRKSSRDI